MRASSLKILIPRVRRSRLNLLFSMRNDRLSDMKRTGQLLQNTPLVPTNKRDEGLYLPLIHSHFQHTLLILYLRFGFVKSLDEGHHGYSTAINLDFRSCISDVETKVKDILDGLAETPWINDEFKKVDRGMLTEELTDGSDHFIGRIFLARNIALFQLQDEISHIPKMVK